jgi:uncharacterized protein YqeY
MGLFETITRDMQAAMKGGDPVRLTTLRTLRAALKDKEIDKRGSGGPMTEEDAVQVLRGAAKKRRESIDLFLQGGRKESADQEQKELDIIQEYLPKQMSEQDIEGIVRTIIDQAASKEFPKVMPLAMKELKGKADGKMVQDVVKRLLGA